MSILIIGIVFVYLRQRKGARTTKVTVVESGEIAQNLNPFIPKTRLDTTIVNRLKRFKFMIKKNTKPSTKSVVDSSNKEVRTKIKAAVRSSFINKNGSQKACSTAGTGPKKLEGVLKIIKK